VLHGNLVQGLIVVAAVDFCANGFEAKFEGFVSMNVQYRCKESFVDEELFFLLLLLFLFFLGTTVFRKA